MARGCKKWWHTNIKDGRAILFLDVPLFPSPICMEPAAIRTFRLFSLPKKRHAKPMYKVEVCSDLIYDY